MKLLQKISRRMIGGLLPDITAHQLSLEKTSPQTKIALRSLYLNYRASVERGEKLPSVWNTGFRIFSQFEEDGIILFLLGAVGIGPAKFVDIGAGDGVWASNCANLALNLGFDGLFMDGNRDLINKGMKFYADHPDTHFYPPRFRHALVTRNNINEILGEAGFEGEVDLLSIDIDGNDYWIWEAIECIQPRIVVIETHTEFGQRSIVVPYKEDFVWQPGMNPHYLGASPVAMTKLADRLGYRLVGANRFGFNAFYLRRDLGTDLIPEVDVANLFRHPRNRERMQLFETIKDYEFVSV
jgi:hypothetical protein